MESEVRANRLFFQISALFVAATLTLNLISDLVLDWVKATFLPNAPTFLVVAILSLLLMIVFFVFTRAVARRAGRIFGATVRAYDETWQKPLSYLLMGYSPMGAASHAEALAELEALGPAIAAAPVEHYEAAVKAAGRQPLRNQWQQNLRAAWHHRDRLKAVYVLEPDISHFDKLSTYLSTALRMGGCEAQIIRISDAEQEHLPFVMPDIARGGDRKREYEDYEYVFEGFRRGLDMIRARPDARAILGNGQASRWSRLFGPSLDDALDAETCVDATAGTKIFSIAAAAMTLNRPLRFSYVTTPNNGVGGGQVRFYDTSVRISGNSG